MSNGSLLEVHVHVGLLTALGKHQVQDSLNVARTNRLCRPNCCKLGLLLPNYHLKLNNSVCTIGAVHKVRHAIFGQFWTPPLSHIRGPPKNTSHISDTSRFLVGLVQKTRTKAICTNSLSIVRAGFCPGVLSGGLLSEGFVLGGFCPFPLLSEYICYNRKLNITWNFMFHMYDKKFISVTSHALDPSPCHKLSHFLGPPPTSSVTYFMDGPLMLSVYSRRVVEDWNELEDETAISGNY